MKTSTICATCKDVLTFDCFSKTWRCSNNCPSKEIKNADLRRGVLELSRDEQVTSGELANSAVSGSEVPGVRLADASQVKTFKCGNTREHEHKWGGFPTKCKHCGLMYSDFLQVVGK